jgi:hypothetical protein
MPLNVRALIVVLGISAFAFYCAKPIAVRYCAPEEFSRRRNLWFVLTLAGFLLPSFWLFVLLAAPLLFWAGRKESNPIALYLLLMHVIPPLSVQIPVVGINEFFSVDMYRLLAMTVLLPAALRYRRSRDDSHGRYPRLMEFLLIAYGLMQVVLFVRPDVPNPLQYHNSFTTCLRTAFLYLIDAYLLYYVASRTATDRRRLKDCLAAFVIACLIMALIAVFEGLKHWALYAGLESSLGADLMHQYNFRGGSLRAVASSGHSLALGYLLAVALGCWLYLRRDETRSWVRLAAPLLLGLGLIFAYSRGPWAGAVVIFLTYALLGREPGKSGFLKMLIVSAVLGAAILASPLGNRIVSVIPFVGKPQSTANVVYRERLAQRSMQMIDAHPFFGDQNAYPELSDLRQGEGIIDFVNTYAFVAVFYGLVGLFCFAGFLVIALARTYRLARSVRNDVELAHLGNSLVATMLGTLVMIASCSFIYGYAQMFYLLAGMAVAYARVVQADAVRSKLAEAGVRAAQCA